MFKVIWELFFCSNHLEKMIWDSGNSAIFAQKRMFYLKKHQWTKVESNMKTNVYIRMLVRLLLYKKIKLLKFNSDWDEL